jgi:2'-5' RNA ligase
MLTLVVRSGALSDETGPVRLFAALMLPPHVSQWLRARQERAVERSSRLPAELRWAHPEQWHLTLAFFGEVEERHVDDLGARLVRASARRPPLHLTLAAPGTFGSARRARVVWQGVGGDVVRLRGLAASCRAAGRRIGLQADGLAARARFRPHVTLARLPRPGDVTDVLDVLAGSDYPSWHAEEAVLVRSDLGAGPRGRARHTVLSRLPLQAARDGR